MHSGAFSCLNVDYALKTGLKQHKNGRFFTGRFFIGCFTILARLIM
jgi:hypothetical protein